MTNVKVQSPNVEREVKAEVEVKISKKNLSLNLNLARFEINLP
jgi:hypothetical protein